MTKLVIPISRFCSVRQVKEQRILPEIFQQILEQAWVKSSSQMEVVLNPVLLECYCKVKQNQGMSSTIRIE